METPQLFTPDNAGSPDHFIVEDLLNFSNDDAAAAANFESAITDSTESSTVTAVGSCNSSGSDPNSGGDCGRNVGDGQFAAADLSVPYDDLAELDQWLSNFVEESFSSEDLQKLQLISGMKARPNQSPGTRKSEPEEAENDIIIDTTFDPDMPVPGKARSKRSRVAPCNWASRLSVLSPSPSPTTFLFEHDYVVPTPQLIPKKPAKITGIKKRDGNTRNAPNGEGRKCLHCATDKTPQWRTGPLGPKTLCNACGVRYKSGRLVPEYRPAASPTSVLTKHSNSHRKVMELRRQKEMMKAQQQQFVQHLHQNMVFDVSNGDDYLIHQHVGPDFRQLT